MKLPEIEIHRYGLLKLDRKKLPTKVVVAIARNLDALTAVYREEDQKRIDLLRECVAKDRSGKLLAEEDENGQKKYKFKKAGEKRFNAEYGAMLEKDFNIPIIKITTADLEACDGQRFDALTVGEAQALTFMLQ